MASE
jgi:hypothetical protein